jgi:hypothetical protein
MDAASNSCIFEVLRTINPWPSQYATPASFKPSEASRVRLQLEFCEKQVDFTGLQYGDAFLGGQWHEQYLGRVTYYGRCDGMTDIDG